MSLEPTIRWHIVCVISTFSGIWINRVERLPILLVLENVFSLSPFAPENLVSRDGFGRFRPAPACSFSALRLNLVLPYRILPAFHDGIHVMYTDKLVLQI